MAGFQDREPPALFGSSFAFVVNGSLLLLSGHSGNASPEYHLLGCANAATLSASVIERWI
jgi:hypothetical protein